MDLIKAVSRAISVGGIDHGHRQVVFAMIQIREKYDNITTSSDLQAHIRLPEIKIFRPRYDDVFRWNAPYRHQVFDDIGTQESAASGDQHALVLPKFQISHEGQ